MKTQWPTGLVSFYKDLSRVAPKVLYGTLVTVDPSIGSRDSQPGYAVFEKGVLSMSGTMAIDHKLSVYKRARLLHEMFSLMLPAPPDVLGIERLPTSFANVRCIWSAGITVAAMNATQTIEICIPFWKAYAKTRPKYVKGDEADAVVMGEALIAYCKESLRG